MLITTCKVRAMIAAAIGALALVPVCFVVHLGHCWCYYAWGCSHINQSPITILILLIFWFDILMMKVCGYDLPFTGGSWTIGGRYCRRTRLWVPGQWSRPWRQSTLLGDLHEKKNRQVLTKVWSHSHSCWTRWSWRSRLHNRHSYSCPVIEMMLMFMLDTPTISTNMVTQLFCGDDDNNLVSASIATCPHKDWALTIPAAINTLQSNLILWHLCFLFDA